MSFKVSAADQSLVSLFGDFAKVPFTIDPRESSAGVTRAYYDFIPGLGNHWRGNRFGNHSSFSIFRDPRSLGLSVNRRYFGPLRSAFVHVPLDRSQPIWVTKQAPLQTIKDPARRLFETKLLYDQSGDSLRPTRVTISRNRTVDHPAMKMVIDVKEGVNRGIVDVYKNGKKVAHRFLCYTIDGGKINFQDRSSLGEVLKGFLLRKEPGYLKTASLTLPRMARVPFGSDNQAMALIQEVVDHLDFSHTRTASSRKIRVGGLITWGRGVLSKARIPGPLVVLLIGAGIFSQIEV